MLQRTVSPSLLAIALLGLVGCQGTPFFRVFHGPGEELEVRAPSPHDGLLRTRIGGAGQVGVVGDDLFPAPVPDGSGVVLSSDRHSSDLKLYLHQTDRAGAVRLTHGSGNDIHPAVSPDGSSIAFASDRDGDWRLYLLPDLTGASTPRPITERGATALHPSWSPDGKTVCYMRQSPKGPWQVWVLELATGTERIITEGLFPEFHPTLDQIVLQRARDRDQRWYSIHLVDLVNGMERELHAEPAGGAVNPSFSPDGRYIVFNSVGERANDDAHPATGDDLFVISANPAEGEGERRLTETEGSEWNPVWGRDGRIYYTTTEEGRTQIYRIEVPSLLARLEGVTP